MEGPWPGSQLGAWDTSFPALDQRRKGIEGCSTCREENKVSKKNGTSSGAPEPAAQKPVSTLGQKMVLLSHGLLQV